jgi:hypothetical protein
MLRAIQPRAVCLDCIEEQNDLGAIPARMCNYRNQVARFVRHPIPSPTDHKADARSLDIPRSDRGRVCRVTPNRDDDVAVRVLPPILFYDASIRNIFGHIEHRARMMSEGRTGRSYGSDRDNQARNCLLHPHLPFNRWEQDGQSFRQKKGTIRANCGRVTEETLSEVVVNDELALTPAFRPGQTHAHGQGCASIHTFT